MTTPRTAKKTIWTNGIHAVKSGFGDRDGDHFIALTNGIDHIHPVNNFAEDGMFPIQMRLGRMRDEKLAAVGSQGQHLP